LIEGKNDKFCDAILVTFFRWRNDDDVTRNFRSPILKV